MPTRSEISPVTLIPALVRIRGSWFLMGSDAGQDCERPIHRVWVDDFELAATQVTNAQYEQFLQAGSRVAAAVLDRPELQSPRSAGRRSFLA